MPYGVPPAGSARPEVRVVVQNVLVDVGKHQFSFWSAQDGHGNQPDVAVLGLGLFGLESPGEQRVTR